MKITEKEFNSLFSKTITKAKYDKIISKINNRFVSIIMDLHIQKPQCGGSWYDYDNYTYCDDGSNGFFDPIEYKYNIGIGGTCSFPPPFNGSIPTRWLWEDYYKEMVDMIEKEKQSIITQKKKQKLNRQQSKERKQKLIESIKSKLSKEELKIIQFKKL